MAIIKADKLGVSVAKGPSLMTGAVPKKDWWDVPAIFKPGNYAYPAKKEIMEYHAKKTFPSHPELFGQPRD
ncbi:MAG: (Fe-S)-binding protein, partial [Desulfurivibrionaceae bacterium]